MNDFVIMSDFSKDLLGCEFVDKYEYPYNSKRRFIEYVWSKFHVEDQYGCFSSIDAILLYPTGVF